MPSTARLVHIFVARNICYCYIPLNGGLDHLVRRLTLLRGTDSRFGQSYHLIAGEEYK